MNQRTTSEIERDIARTRAEMSETIDAIQQRLSPGQMFEQLLHYFSSGSGRSFADGAGAFARNMGRTIRDNPVPVALVATGLAWLMVSRGRQLSPYAYDPYDDYDEYDEYDDYERLDEDWSRHYGTSAYDAPSAYDDRPEPADRSTAGVGPSSQAGGAPRGPGGSVGAASVSEMQGGEGEDRGPDRSGTADARAREAADEARRRASRAADDARKQAGDFRSTSGPDAYPRTEEHEGGARERMRHASERARHGMDRAAHAARRRAREAADAGRRTAWSTRRRVRRAGSSVGHLIDERPLVVGLVGLAIGALLGALLPATRREDEWMGETRDDLARRARAEIDKAERVAERAVDTARSEAAQRDLTPEGARRAAANTVRDAERAAEARIKDVGERLREVGEATREAAEDEAKRQDLGSGRTPNP